MYTNTAIILVETRNNHEQKQNDNTGNIRKYDQSNLYMGRGQALVQP
jgi:hypothetical protein